MIQIKQLSYLLLTFLILLTDYSYSQNRILDSIAENNISKNILIYRISKFDFFKDFEGVNNIDYNSKVLLPNENEYLELISINENKLIYPIENYTLYKIYNVNDYVFNQKGNSDLIKINYSHGEPNDILLSKTYLIAYNLKTNHIIYISGEFFKDPISKDFNLDKNNPESFFIFLSFKLYNYDLKEVRMLKNRRNSILYEAYSNTLKENILIKVSSNNFDNIKVKIINTCWTEKGSYKW